MTPTPKPGTGTRERKRSAVLPRLPEVGAGLAVAAAFLSPSPKRVAVIPPDPTFAEDVAPILYKNCTDCHRYGGIGPMPLFDYAIVKAYAPKIREKITKGLMPPWHATGPRGVFRNDRRLSDADRNTILRWIDAGAQPGDLRKLPPRPVYPDWAIGTPDVVLSMQQEFEVPATGTIAYQDFEVPTNFTEDKWIRAYEIRPGARPVVHHVQVYARMPPAPPRPPGAPPFRPALVRNRMHEPPNPPERRGFFARLFRRPAWDRDRGTLIASMAAGTDAVEFPEGTALMLRAGTVLTFVMHYTAHGHAMKDRSAIGFKFAKEPPAEEIHASAFVNEAFTIPSGAKDVAVPSEIGARESIRIWGLLPHTHLRGSRWHYQLAKPGGTVETILDVPNYDFNWQTYYLFTKPLELPPGSKITAVAWYDNSRSNPSNPDPTKVVKYGPQTWDEMQYTGILFSVPSWDRARTWKR
ncbi:MAG: c-type cytochrome [Gemmatimonadales bacterium]